MADNAVIGIDIITRLDQFRAEMAKIPDIGGKEAKALTAQLSKEIKAAETAAKKAAEASKGAKNAMNDAANAADKFGDSAGKLGSNAGKLAGILDTLVPGAGDLARTVADVADAGEVAATASKGFGVSLASIASVAGPVAVAIGVLALAYNHYKGELEAAEAKQKQSLDILEDVRGLTDEIDAAKRRLTKAMGGEGAIQAENTEIDLKWQAVAEKSLKTLKEKEQQLRENLQVEKDRTTLDNNLEAINAATAALEDNLEEQRKYNQLARTGAQLDKDAAEYTREKADSDKVLAERAKDRADAQARAAKRALEDAEALRKATDAAQSYVDALGAIQEVEDDAIKSQLDAYGRLEEAREEDLRSIQRAKQKALDSAVAGGLDVAKAEEVVEKEASEARLAVWDAYYADLDKLRENEIKAASDSVSQQTDVEAEALEELYNQSAQMAGDAAAAMEERYSEAYDRISGNVIDLMEYQDKADKYLTASQKRELKERIKREKEAAREMFEAQKAAALADIAIKVAQGVMDVWSKYAEFPPIAIALSAPVIAAGAVEAAVVAGQQPAFHAGGPLDMAPDELSVTARKGEYMVNPQGRSVLGDETLRRANAGQSSQSAVYAVSVYRHTRQVDKWKEDGLAAGDPISRAINEGKLVGHRSNR